MKKPINLRKPNFDFQKQCDIWIQHEQDLKNQINVLDKHNALLSRTLDTKLSILKAVNREATEKIWKGEVEALNRANKHYEMQIKEGRDANLSLISKIKALQSEKDSWEAIRMTNLELKTKLNVFETMLHQGKCKLKNA